MTKKKFAAFLFIISLITPRCYTQEATPVWLKLAPTIPATLTEPAQRAEFLVLHFWDNFDFLDRDFLMKDNLLERSFVDYIDLFSLVPQAIRDQAVKVLMKKAEKESTLFSYILKLSERYLYEPDSPLYNEEIFIPFLQFVSGSSLLNDAEKIRPSFLLSSVLKNRTGTVANDFTYTLMNGEKGTLFDIKANYTLVYFNDPECDDCKNLIKQLNGSTVINQAIQSGALKIIAFYVNEDLQAWKKHAPDVLPFWIYAYDAEQKVNMEGTYNIKRFPTMYLLDGDKKVVLKDTSFDNLENFIKKIPL